MVFALPYSWCFELFCSANILEVHLWDICTKWLKISTYMVLTLWKSFIFLLVHFIAVSLHCSSYYGKTSRRFREFGDLSQRYLLKVTEIYRMWGSDVRIVYNGGFEQWDIKKVFIKGRYVRHWVAHLLQIVCCMLDPSTVIAPPLPGLNLVDWELIVICSLVILFCQETSQHVFEGPDEVI